MVELIIKPFRPLFPGWTQWEVGNPEFERACVAVERWYHQGCEVMVISALENMSEPGREPRVEYHVSLTGLRFLAAHPHRATTSQVQWALAQFGCEGALEDNHVPHGIARHFFRPIADPLVGETCPCEEAEPLIVEDKGEFTWRGT